MAENQNFKKHDGFNGFPSGSPSGEIHENSRHENIGHVDNRETQEFHRSPQIKESAKTRSKSEKGNQAGKEPMNDRILLVCAFEELNFASEKWKNEINREMINLCFTAGLEVVNLDRPCYARIKKIVPRTYLSEGVLDEINLQFKDYTYDFIVLNLDVSPSQQNNLAQFFSKKVITKTELIYEIFLERASSSVSKTQIELANLIYIKSRLSGSYKNMDRIRGGIGTRGSGIGTRGGSGETKLEIDRRNIEKRIAFLKNKLKKVEKHFELIYKNHALKNSVAVVGYTNAGKSSLVNSLTNADLLEENLLFSTVDVRTKKLYFAPEFSCLLTDTIGFIRDLPHNLVDSFKTTLLEIRYSKLVLHVVDINSEFYIDHMKNVEKTLEEIGCDRIKRVIVFNKIDSFHGPLDNIRSAFPQAFFVSAKDKLNLDSLKNFIYTYFSGKRLPHTDNKENHSSIHA